MIKPLSALLSIALIAAASPQDKAGDVMRALRQQDATVAAVGYRLVTANVALCPKRFVESGMTLGTLAQYDAPYRTAAARVLGMTDRPTVELVVPGSPADKAGIKAGDVLVSADATMFATTPVKSADASFGSVDAAMTMLDTALADGRAALVIDRGGQRVTLDVVGAPACRSRFQVAGDDLDAFVTDSVWVKISPRMVEFAADPAALAAVMAHELAHNALGHHKGKPSVQRVQELQADRLAPYLMARAGYDPAAMVALWQRFKARRLGGLIRGAAYPNWAVRLQAVEAERARIVTLSSRADPILPPDDIRPR